MLEIFKSRFRLELLPSMRLRYPLPKHGKAEQSKARQRKALQRQNRAMQSKAQQSKARQSPLASPFLTAICSPCSRRCFLRLLKRLRKQKWSSFCVQNVGCPLLEASSPDVPYGNPAPSWGITRRQFYTMLKVKELHAFIKAGLVSMFNLFKGMKEGALFFVLRWTLTLSRKRTRAILRAPPDINNAAEMRR